MTEILRIGSRPSPLAIIQAEMVRAAIAAAIPGLKMQIVPIRTSGDKMLTSALADVGGKGLFIKELEQALSEHSIDIAVHSMKDLPALLLPQFRIAATPERDNPRDALVTRDGARLNALPRGAKVGTSSARRKLMALKINQALVVTAVRGNVDTRIGRVQAGELDATILAMAGLKRLGKLSAIKFQELDEREFVPSAAQAALAIEALADEKICGSDEIEKAIDALNHAPTVSETTAERAFLASIHASCVSPVGVKASATDENIAIRAILFSVDGSRELCDEISDRARSGDSKAAARVGEKLGAKMVSRGARKILDEA